MSCWSTLFPAYDHFKMTQSKFMFYSKGSIGNFVGFASQWHLLVNALESSLDGQFMEDFVSGLKLYSSLVHTSDMFIFLTLVYISL